MVLASAASGDTVNQTARIPTWTPCSTDPVAFNCQDCEIGWNPCRLRIDDSLRHWRAAQHSRYSGLLSANDERDNNIESEIVRFLLSHGVSVNVSLLLKYVPREILEGITSIELETLLRKSPKFVESSPRMFKLKASLLEEGGVASFRPLPLSSGTQLESLMENSPTLGGSRQTSLFKEFSGLNLLASFDTRRAARTALDKIVRDYLDAVLSRRDWTIRALHKYAVGPETVPSNGVLSEDDVSVTSRLLSAVSANELLTRMSPEEAVRLVPEVRETLILGNLRLVASEARKRAHGGFLTFADLVQVGTIGLMTALERFDPFRGFQFSTYATSWIRQAISREQANLDRSIRLPVYLTEELNSLLRLRKKLDTDWNRSPTNVELANELGLKLDRVEFLLQLEHHPESLDLLLEEADDVIEKDSRLRESAKGGVLDNLWDGIVRDAVEKVLFSLSSREAQIVTLRYGLGAEDELTLEQIGQRFGLTRERIRQIEAKALRKIRKSKIAYQLRDLLW